MTSFRVPLTLTGVFVVACTMLLSVVLSGCSSTDSSIAPPAETSGVVSVERQVFTVASRFYCERLTWPKSWDELYQFQLRAGRDVSGLAAVKEPGLSSARAILLTLEYANEPGAKRKVTFIAPPECEARSGRDNRDVSIAGGGVFFRLPRGFDLMKGSQIVRHWRAPPYPDAAWTADDGTLVAVRFGDIELETSEIASFLQDVTEAYQASVPSLVWHSQDVKKLGSTTMLRHEFENISSRGKLLNVVLSGSFDHRLFAITVTGPVERVESIEQAAQSIESTLKVR